MYQTGETAVVARAEAATAPFPAVAVARPASLLRMLLHIVVGEVERLPVFDRVGDVRREVVELAHAFLPDRHVAERRDPRRLLRVVVVELRPDRSEAATAPRAVKDIALHGLERAPGR